jgi:hypothetical protein
MKVFRLVLIWLNCLLALAGGVVLMLWPGWISRSYDAYGGLGPGGSAPPQAHLLDLLDQLGTCWTVALFSELIGGLLVLISMLLVWAAIRAWLPGNYVADLEFTDESGGFTISIRAIEQSLARALHKLPEVHDMRVSVFVGRKDSSAPMRILAEGSVYEDHNLHRLQEQIRATLKQRFRGMVHLTEEVRYDVHLYRMIPQSKSRKNAEGSEGCGSEGLVRVQIPFSGPQYPVEPEDEERAARS